MLIKLCHTTKWNITVLPSHRWVYSVTPWSSMFAIVRVPAIILSICEGCIWEIIINIVVVVRGLTVPALARCVVPCVAYSSYVGSTWCCKATLSLAVRWGGQHFCMKFYKNPSQNILSVRLLVWNFSYVQYHTIKTRK